MQLYNIYISNFPLSFQKGQRRLKEFKSMVGYIDTSNNSNSTEDQDADSWLNIDDKEDPRGRVGTNWPWNESK